jgi:hypothetical protein
MIGDYFEFLKKIANKNPEVVRFRIIKEFIGISRGFIRFVIELRDGSELHVFEYVDSGLHKIDYSYHWQNKDKNLISRWDNAPHHSEIDTFPHHKHNGEDILPSAEPTFVEILKKIGAKELGT